MSHVSMNSKLTRKHACMLLPIFLFGQKCLTTQIYVVFKFCNKCSKLPLLSFFMTNAEVITSSESPTLLIGRYVIIPATCYNLCQLCFHYIVVHGIKLTMSMFPKIEKGLN